MLELTTADRLELETRDPATWKTLELAAYVGGLSAPSKMPGYAYSLPAKECRTGGKLQLVEGSTCHSCYALKGRYAFPNVQAALYRRLESITRDAWSAAMAELITRKRQTWFRWHDSGDLQTIGHLAAIVRVCELTPAVRHWLPTREYRIVQDYLTSEGTFPANLNVRMSAHMVGGAIPTFPRLPVTVSTVSAGDEPPDGARRCPAPQQGNSCGDCRACWDPSVPIVDYHLH
jgi:hypothetical protein